MTISLTWLREFVALPPSTQELVDLLTLAGVEVEEVHPVADKASIRFQITLGLAGGATMYIRGVEVFTITDDGLISAVEAYWGEEDVTFA